MFLNKRYNLFALFLIGFFIYIVSFLFDLQVLSRDTALSAIDNQTTDTFYITAPRGDIFDDQNDTATIGPFHKAQDSPIVNSFFSTSDR